MAYVGDVTPPGLYKAPTLSSTFLTYTNMDFINKLTGDNRAEHTSNPHTNADEGRLVDRIGSTYDHQGATGEHDETLASKIGSSFHHSDTRNSHSNNPAVGAVSQETVHDEGGNLINKITTTFSTHSVGAQPPKTAGTTARLPPGPSEDVHHSNPHAQPGLIDKISTAFTHQPQNASETVRDSGPPPPPKDSFVDKLTSTFGDGQHGTTTAAPKNEHGGWVHNTDEPPKEGGLMNKISGAFGGGAKGEAKEDHLDKAIDAFQEHALKEGPQHNESALEQAKDGQIAGAIRSGYKNLTGHEFPVHEKK